MSWATVSAIRRDESLLKQNGEPAMLKNLAIIVGLMAGLSACIPYGYNGYDSTGYGYNQPAYNGYSYNTTVYGPYNRTPYYGPGFSYRY